MNTISDARKDFPMFSGDCPPIYFDNASTTFKPNCVIEAVIEYYKKYSVNFARGEYDLSYTVDEKVIEARKNIGNFINAFDEEIIFTGNTTDGINLVAFGYATKLLKKDDVILISEIEHASNLLPWIKVAKLTGCQIKCIPIKNGVLDIDGFKKMLDDRVKMVAINHISNVLGFVNPVKEICRLAHLVNAVVLIDGAQSVGHIPVDVKDINCDFMAFSGHKMCGPNGSGILYGKYDLLHKMEPIKFGGGSNVDYTVDFQYFLKNPPYKFESGTLPIESILGLSAAINYIRNIGIDKIREYVFNLHKYTIKKMSAIEHLTIYNSNSDAGIITFNINGIFSQDAAKYFNSKGICLRSGQHCARLVNKYINVSSTLRASLYFYNTYDDVDRFIEVCKSATKENCIRYIFND